MAGSVGMDLRHARERAHLSLTDVSARTKIRIPILEAIEREQFERLPAGLLTRGYLRAYAREVGLDPESVVHQYVAEFEPERLPPPPPRPEPQETEWESEPATRTRWAILAPAIPLTLAVLFFVLVNRPAGVVPPAPDGPDVPVAPVVATTGPQEIHAAPIDQPAAPAADRLRLEIHPTAVTWVDAAADGTRVLYELIDTGQRRTIEADREIVLRVGDAAAFAYSINGMPGRPLGGPGEVRDIRITLDTAATFALEE